MRDHCCLNSAASRKPPAASGIRSVQADARPSELLGQIAGRPHVRHEDRGEPRLEGGAEWQESALVSAADEDHLALRVARDVPQTFESEADGAVLSLRRLSFGVEAPVAHLADGPGRARAVVQNL